MALIPPDKKARIEALKNRLSLLQAEARATELEMQVELLEIARRAGIRNAFEVDLESGTIAEIEPEGPGE